MSPNGTWVTDGYAFHSASRRADCIGPLASGPASLGTMTPAHPLDPKSILHQAFEMGEDFPGPAEDLLLSWLFSLGADQQPAEAAKELLPRFAAELAGK